MKDYLEIPSYEKCVEIVNECKAFSHSTQELNGKKVESFKYNLMMPLMWDEKTRINMRGITFVDQKLVALPFPKFFNLCEHESTSNIDFGETNFVFEKIDGSLISFFKIGDSIELKTMKSVESDVANVARTYFHDSRKDISDFVESLLEKGLSPIFEFVSSSNRIVIDYGKTNLVFLGCRNLITGKIIYPNQIDVPASIDTPKIMTKDEMAEYLKREDVEGVVVVMKNGLMLKMKTETYCRIHKVLDGFNPKNIVDIIINDKLDDTIGVLSNNNLTAEVLKAKGILVRYNVLFSEIYDDAENYYKENKHRERKDIAIELRENNRELAGLVFLLLDGKSLNESINKRILKLSKTWEF